MGGMGRQILYQLGLLLGNVMICYSPPIDAPYFHFRHHHYPLEKTLNQSLEQESPDPTTQTPSPPRP